MSTNDARSSPSATPNCPRCGAPVRSAQDNCPRCLLELAQQPAATPDSASGATGSGGVRPGPPPSLEEVRAAFPSLEIEVLLGQGGMGSVFKARQPQLDRIVALKVLSRSLGDDPAFAERFQREARTLARLGHPGIVAVHDFGCADGLHFLIMELVDGVNLRQLMQGDRLEPRQALAIAAELCDALQYAHDEGVVHRDIKPENVLVDARGRVKVADFGLAKLVDPTADAGLTRSDQVMGTPHYMAPEQMERPLEVDHRADLFALGVVLYEMLTGSLPRGAFEPPSQRVRVDVQLDRIVLKALEREPTRRYQAALEIKTDVDDVSAGKTSAGAAVAPPARHRGARRQGPSADEIVGAPGSGWRTTAYLAAAWILLGVAWNLGPFAAGVGAVVVVVAFVCALGSRVGKDPEWVAALGQSTRVGWLSRRAFLFVGGMLAVGSILLGHVLHWERGVHGWEPSPRGVTGMFEQWARQPWDLLQLAAPAGEITAFVPSDSRPRVVMEQNLSSAPLDLPAPWSWVFLLGGFVLLAVVLAAGARVSTSRELTRRAWHTGAEVSAYGLCALLVLWLAAPIASLRSDKVLQQVTTGFAVGASEADTIDRLRASFDRLGLEVDVEQHARVIDQRDGGPLARAIFLRAASPDPFERWSTSLAGPLRESPLLWVTICPRLAGSGSPSVATAESVQIMMWAGLLDPRSPEHEAAHDVLKEIRKLVGGQ